MALFIIDFDETIVSENTHNAVSHLSNGTIHDVWTIIKEIAPIGRPETWRDTIRFILDQGHNLAIASFNAYGPIIIPKYLREVIGLREDEVKLIHIESWLPLNPRTADKNEHIKCSIKDIEYIGFPDSIVLVDDDLKNITAAKKYGYRTIHATGNYIEQIRCLSKDWNHSIASTDFFPNFFKKANLSGKQKDAPASNAQCMIM